MDPSWINIFSFLTVFTLAIISPGPNFALVANRAMSGNRKEGLLIALGVATGSGLFGLVGLLGLIVVVSSLPHFSLLLRIVGGTYLSWVGFTMLRGAFYPAAPQPNRVVHSRLTAAAIWRVGLMTNLSNPKAWAFYIALFTLMTTSGLLFWQKALLNGSMFLISLAWYATVALAISSAKLQPLFHKTAPLLGGLLGITLLACAGQILFNITWGGITP